MNPIIYESGEKKALLYTSYFFLKNIAISTALGALAGRILKWYTPSHGAIMGAFSGAVGFAAKRISGNQFTQSTEILTRLHEEKRAIQPPFSIENKTKLAKNEQQSEVEVKNLLKISILCFASYLAAPLSAKFFQKTTDLRLAFRFHLSSSLIGSFAFSKMQQTFFASMSENGRAVWLENWAEREWLTRASSELPPVNATIDWNNFTRVPKPLALDDKVPNSGVNQWETLCQCITWDGRRSPFATIKKAVECIDEEAVKRDSSYRYTQNLMAQLYLKLHRLCVTPTKDLEKLRSILIFLEEELKNCQSRWLNAIYKTLQNCEAEKPALLLQLQTSLPNSTINQWEELCSTITNWGINQEVNEGSMKDSPATSPFEKIAEVFDSIQGFPANLMAQLYQKLAEEKNLEERKRFLLVLKSNLFQEENREKAIGETLSQYLKESSNHLHSEIEQWALVIDQDIREDLLKKRIASDFEPSLSDVHTYEVVKGVLAKENLFTKVAESDGHAQFEQANPGAKEIMQLLHCGTDPFEALRKNVAVSKSQWIASFKHRYHAETVFAVFIERLNSVYKQSKDHYIDIQLVLAQNVRKLLGEEKISLTQAKELVEKELCDGHQVDEKDEDLCLFIPTSFNNNGVIFFLQTFGFFEASTEIVQGKTPQELLKTYTTKN